MKIEKFKMQYYHDIVELWRRAGIGVGSSDTKDEVAAVLERNPDLFLVGKEDGKIMAGVIGTFDGRRGYVHHLTVDPDYQKKGYGKLIMDELIELFRNMKVHKIHLFIQKTNSQVVEFYNKFGWEIRDDIIMMSYVPNKELYKRAI
ncbi:MAG: GNAT family N-acetyltransferase [Candidatus Lokiarchaeota archaeon]|jgi:ribosomal protein S18 acetylase RimI-like enzyme|nr:GNAT family N-acetyltransferase [Candidatus Lokiarchaeota archaeon]